jgi:hypothetical protein
MVNVEMREQDHVELGHIRATLSESKSASTTGIDEHPHLSVLPHQITAGSALVL